MSRRPGINSKIRAQARAVLTQDAVASGSSTTLSDARSAMRQQRASAPVSHRPPRSAAPKLVKPQIEFYISPGSLVASTGSWVFPGAAGGYHSVKKGMTGVVVDIIPEASIGRQHRPARAVVAFSGLGILEAPLKHLRAVGLDEDPSEDGANP